MMQTNGVRRMGHRLPRICHIFEIQYGGLEYRHVSSAALHQLGTFSDSVYAFASNSWGR